MAVPTSLGKLPVSAAKPDYQSFLALPACYDPTMTAADWQAELDRMHRASVLTRDFTAGSLSPDDYSDGLADLAYDPHWLDQLWSEGYSLRGQ